MNPSASGWIDKFGVVIKHEAIPLFSDLDAFYTHLKSVGFIYGVNIATLEAIPTKHSLEEDEFAKINLITAFYIVYRFETGTDNFNAFLESMLSFYKSFGKNNASFLGKLFAVKNTSRQLEKYIHSRVHIDENIFTKNFSKLLTNSLLFIDVLAYRSFISKAIDNIPEYVKKLEHNIINFTYHALNAKEKKTKYHKQFIKLFEASLRYQEKDTFSLLSYDDFTADIMHPLEKKYIVDIAAMAVWEDGVIDTKETSFIWTLGETMHLEPQTVKDAIAHVHTFYEKHKAKLPHLNNAHFIKNFYDNSSKMVSSLIIRNKKRLQQELLDSKELVVLLSKSTSKELSKEEKKKVKKQLIDIFKVIPSLAIFALPGGSVLLPLFVKLIPKLLPSAFDDNRID